MSQTILDCFPGFISQFGLLGCLWSVMVVCGLLYVAYDMLVDLACIQRPSASLRNTMRRANYRR